MRARGETRWVAAVAIAIVVASACGGKIEPERVGSTDAPPSSTSSSSGSSGASSSGSDTPLPPTASGAGSVACGTTSCATPDEVCCSRDDDKRCASQGGRCDGAVIACDQPADCPSDRPLCCWLPRNNDIYGWSSQCAETCIRDAITFEACQSDSDCRESKGPCTTHTCGGRTYRFCQQVTQLCSP